MDKKVRTIVIDGVEIQTSLTAVEIADLAVKNADLQQRISQAVEYIKQCQLGITEHDEKVMLAEEDEGIILLNILKGDDNE